LANEGLIWGALIFYAVIGLLLSSAGAAGISSTQGSAAVPVLVASPSFGQYVNHGWAVIGYFFRTIAFSVSGLPFWVNLIIFVPLSLVLIYALIQVIISAVQAVVP
jgi:hypothetical protein